MRSLIILITILSAGQLYGQMENFPVKIENNTSYAFNCDSYTGDAFTITQQMSKEATAVMPGKIGVTFLMAGYNGAITWVDNAKGAKVILRIGKDATGKRVFSTETSHNFTASVEIIKGIVNGKDMLQLVLGGSYEYKPIQGKLIPVTGNASSIIRLPVNISVTGKPMDTVWQHAFDLTLTVPNYFYPAQNGQDKYNNQQGNFRGIQYIDAKQTWGFRYEQQNGDSILVILIQAEKIPEGVPVTVSLTPTYSSKWVMGSKYPIPSRTTGKYYVVYTSEAEPISPHTSSMQTLGLLHFTCNGILWADKLISMEVITQKNFLEKVKPTPEKIILADKKLPMVTTDTVLKKQFIKQQSKSRN